MSKTKLMLGDNIESLKKLPDNSVDSVITDPPYGLSFMNKKWDYDVPSVELWKEVYRVLKPGGHVLSFGGTRTYHRMVVNIEDAGFEIRDQIMWIYGCLDDKSEILTDSGWKKYTDITLNDKALSWNSDLDILEFNKIDDIIIKPYKGDMILLKNKHTEQILTPNHRVYHKYERKDRGYLGDKWEVVEAGDMKSSGNYTLPIASYYEGEGIGGEDYAALLGWIWSEGEFDKKGNAIRISQSSVNQPLVDEIKDLIERLNIKYSHYTRERFYNYKHKGRQSYTDNSFYFSTVNNINDKIRAELPNKKLNFDFVKRMTIKEKEAFLDAAHKGDGSKGRETIYQNDLSQLELLQFMFMTIGKSSYFNLNKMSVNWRNKSTTQLQHRTLNKKVYYEGDVWCVRVKNSAFVARRGDKAFITGNSGFPKSHNIGKAVDKLQGNEREVIGEPLSYRDSRGGAIDAQITSERERLMISQTKGQSEFEGWGTALKPANEPICLARKPLSEKSVAENVLKWKTGGINIDGCRVGSENNEHHRPTVKKQGNFNNGVDKEWEPTNSDLGRFPANIILECCCDEVIKGEKGEPRISDKKGGSPIFNSKLSVDYKGKWPNDKGDTHTNPNCPCYIMDEQSGVSKSRTKYPEPSLDGLPMNHYETTKIKHTAGKEQTKDGYTDKGGASRFFYQAKVSKAERNMGLDGFEENIHTNPNCPCYIMDEQSGTSDYTNKKNGKPGGRTFGGSEMKAVDGKWPKDKGGASRFFYQAKVSKAERNMGLDGFEDKESIMPGLNTFDENGNRLRADGSIIPPLVSKNSHPTVKPVQLMSYLCRLITPPNGICLDPFMGSGSTGISARLEGFKFIGMEMDEDYMKIAEARIENYEKYRKFLK